MGKEVVKRGGRLERRNVALAARYFYWSEMKRRRFDDVIGILENDEFFVEYQTISRIIFAYGAYFEDLRSMLPGYRVKLLKREFPSWNWE